MMSSPFHSGTAIQRHLRHFRILEHVFRPQSRFRTRGTFRSSRARSGRSYLFGAILVGMAGIATLPAHADVVGPACVVDGNTMQINGQRRHNRCVGGTAVRLFGIVSPDLDQMCDAPGGRKWYCGKASAAILLEAVKGRTLKCQGNSRDRRKRLLVVCYVEGKSLNELLVRNGWALAYRPHSERYLEAEERAAVERKGLWQATKNPAFEWRNR